MPWFHSRKRMATGFARFRSIGLLGPSVGCDAVRNQKLSEIHAKTDQHCRAEDLLGMICHRSLLIRQGNPFISKETSIVRCCSWWTFWTHNIQFKYREGSWHSSRKPWNCWRKKCAKPDSLIRYANCLTSNTDQECYKYSLYFNFVKRNDVTDFTD